MRYSNDPVWGTYKYGREAIPCAGCGEPIQPGDQYLYWPIGRRSECHYCGTTSYARFTAEVMDEEYGCC